MPVPLLTPSLSSRWLALVTNVDVATGRALIDSMTNEVIVRDDSIRSLVPFAPMDYDSAVLAALGERGEGADGEAVSRRGRGGRLRHSEAGGTAGSVRDWLRR